MRKEMMKMTMKVKFDDAAADGIFTDGAWKVLIPQTKSNILLESVSVSIDAYGRAVERERRSKRLAEMSLGALLYYALVGEGTINDEPA